MKTTNYVRITTVILSVMILLKVISILILLFTPLGNGSAALADLIIDIYSEYPEFYVFFDIPFPILYVYWGIRRKIERSYAFRWTIFSIIQILLGLIAFLFSIVHIF